MAKVSNRSTGWNCSQLPFADCSWIYNAAFMQPIYRIPNSVPDQQVCLFLYAVCFLESDFDRRFGFSQSLAYLTPSPSAACLDLLPVQLYFCFSQFVTVNWLSLQDPSWDPPRGINRVLKEAEQGSFNSPMGPQWRDPVLLPTVLQHATFNFLTELSRSPAGFRTPYRRIY